MQSLEYEIGTSYFKRTNTIHHARLAWGRIGLRTWKSKNRPASTHQRIGQGKTYSNLPEIDLRLEKGTNLETHDPNYDIKQLAITCATTDVSGCADVR